MKRESAWRWDAATERLGVARRMASVCWWNGVVTDVATLALWLDQAKLVRGNTGEFRRAMVHEVSVTAVCRLGLGSRMATTAIRP